MRVEDIVLVYENRKGSESKLLLTKKDYVDEFLPILSSLKLRNFKAFFNDIPLKNRANNDEHSRYHVLK